MEATSITLVRARNGCFNAVDSARQTDTDDQLLARSRGPLLAATEASPRVGFAPAPAWANILRHLVELSLAPVPPPPWWTAKTGYRGCIETWRHPIRDVFDSANRLGHDETPVVVFHLGLAGWGLLEPHGKEPQKVSPGKAAFSMAASPHRYCLPPESPGWTFAWIGIQHPLLMDRVGKLAKVTGPLFDFPPEGSIAATFLRLVRGALKKDFRDRFDVELALWEFVLACERWTLESRDRSGQGQRLLETVRSRIVASLPKSIGVDTLAAEFGMSRSHFSHLFRACTGLTPAHYATSVRIHEAARLLRETRVPLKVVADTCGFANANHFCKVFRRFQQLSPTAYRRIIR